MALAVAMCVVCPRVADAKTLYVNGSTGDDSVAYASNNVSTPWRTIARAAWGSISYDAPNTAEGARAGDTVLIAAGTYWENGTTSGSRFTVTLNPVNSGAPGNLVTFRGEGDVQVRLNNGYRGAMIGCQGRDYVVWDHFTIDDTYGGSVSDTGPVVFSSNSNHCQLINSTVRGHDGTYFHGYPTFGGNYRLVGLEDAHHIIIKNNVISRARAANGSLGGQNEGCVLSYDTTHSVVEHNWLADCGVGVFIKGAHSPEVQEFNTIRFNTITDSYHGIRVLGGDDSRVYQNIVAGCAPTAGATGLFVGFSTALRSRWVNNTVYNCARGIALQGTDIVDAVLRNNIVVGSTEGAVYSWASASPAAVDAAFDRNFYDGNTVHASWEGSGNYSFATWQGTYGHDLNGSHAVSPQFIDAGAGNFRLQPASPARTVGIDTLDLDSDGSTTDTIPVGAYISGNETIGPAAGIDTTGPAAPSGLQVM